MPSQFLMDRIAKGSIQSNFHLYPEVIGPFRRMAFEVEDEETTAWVPFAFYSDGTDVGIVTAEELSQGLRQVWAAWNPDAPANSKVVKTAPQLLYAERGKPLTSFLSKKSPDSQLGA